MGGYDECAEIVLTFATHGGPNIPPELATVIYSWNEGTGTVVAVEPDGPEPFIEE